MSRNRQMDLFGADDPQPGLLDEETYVAPVVHADPDTVRAQLLKILAEARAAKTGPPWTSDRTGLYKTIFPQMTRWLPDDEAAQLCFQFETELKRLKAA
jgi:hypothetical protein